MIPIASSGQDWRPAFLAVGAIVGASVDTSLAALGGRGEGRGEAFEGLVIAMTATSREVRARAIARALTPVVVDLERMRLA